MFFPRQTSEQAIHLEASIFVTTVRCRAHKLRNVMDPLPEPEGRSEICNAGSLAAGCQERRVARLKKLAEWLEREHRQAKA